MFTKIFKGQNLNKGKFNAPMYEEFVYHAHGILHIDLPKIIGDELKKELFVLVCTRLHEKMASDNLKNLAFQLFNKTQTINTDDLMQMFSDEIDTTVYPKIKQRVCSMIPGLLSSHKDLRDTVSDGKFSNKIQQSIQLTCEKAERMAVHRHGMVYDPVSSQIKRMMQDMKWDIVNYIKYNFPFFYYAWHVYNVEVNGERESNFITTDPYIMGLHYKQSLAEYSKNNLSLAKPLSRTSLEYWVNLLAFAQNKQNSGYAAHEAHIKRTEQGQAEYNAKVKNARQKEWERIQAEAERKERNAAERQEQQKRKHEHNRDEHLRRVREEHAKTGVRRFTNNGDPLLFPLNNAPRSVKRVRANTPPKTPVAMNNNGGRKVQIPRVEAHEWQTGSVKKDEARINIVLPEWIYTVTKPSRDSTPEAVRRHDLFINFIKNLTCSYMTKHPIRKCRSGCDLASQGIAQLGLCWSNAKQAQFVQSGQNYFNVNTMIVQFKDTSGKAWSLVSDSNEGSSLVDMSTRPRTWHEITPSQPTTYAPFAMLLEEVTKILNAHRMSS